MGTIYRLPLWLIEAQFAILEGLTRSDNPPPLTIIGGDSPYLKRWFLSPRSDGPSVYLHQFLRSDAEDALHDHPYDSIGIILSQGYLDHTPEGVVGRTPGDVVIRTTQDRHRVELKTNPDGSPIPSWSLFLTGNRVRDWGFWCPEDRFVPWRAFTSGTIGCGENG